MDQKTLENDNVILMKFVCNECEEKYDVDMVLIHKTEGGKTFHRCLFCEDEVKAKEFFVANILSALTGGA